MEENYISLYALVLILYFILNNVCYSLIVLNKTCLYQKCKYMFGPLRTMVRTKYKVRISEEIQNSLVYHPPFLSEI